MWSWNTSGRAYAIALDGRLRNVDAELGQFPDDTRRAPGRVGAGEAANELAERLGDGRSCGSASLAQTTPMVAKPGALPGDDGVWFDECQVLAPAGPDSGQEAPEDPVSRRDAGLPTSPLVDRDLMAQGEHFELLYLLSADASKADCAEALVAAGGVISVQVLNEFASVASRKLEMSRAEIREVAESSVLETRIARQGDCA